MNLTDAVKQLTPVFIVAPSARNGITLLQRMLNSTRQIIIYGENGDFMDRLPSLVHSAVNTHTTMGDEFDASRKKFLSETTEYWTSNLWPSSEQNLLIMFEAFNRAAAMYQQCTQQYGFARWGVKNPMITPQMIERLHILLPQARFIFIHRNLYEVVQSARARQFITDDASRDSFIEAWKNNIQAVLSKPAAHVLVVKHDELVTDRAANIANIERFAGISGIDQSVLDRKINTFIGAKSAGMSPTGYIEPRPLTNADTKAIERITGDILSELEYAAC